MTWVGMAFLARTVPELEAVSLPFMFPNREAAYKVMDSDAIGKLLEQQARPTRASSCWGSWSLARVR